jgi:hypothetical protein
VHFSIPQEAFSPEKENRVAAILPWQKWVAIEMCIPERIRSNENNMEITYFILTSETDSGLKGSAI